MFTILFLIAAARRISSTKGDQLLTRFDVRPQGPAFFRFGGASSGL